MVTLEGFKDFAKVYRPGAPAEAAFGILTLTRASQTPPLQPIEIPAGTDFATARRVFYSIEAVTISESASFVPCGVRAMVAGAAGNIAAGQTWTSEISDRVTIANAAAFAGGKEATPHKGDPMEGFAPEDDADLQSHLDVAKEMILKKLGGPETLPDAPSVDRATYLYAQWTRQQRTFQERQRKLGAENEINLSETAYFRQAGTQDALNREIDNLLSGHGNPTAFMP